MRRVALYSIVVQTSSNLPVWISAGASVISSITASTIAVVSLRYNNKIRRADEESRRREELTQRDSAARLIDVKVNNSGLTVVWYLQFPITCITFQQLSRNDRGKFDGAGGYMNIDRTSSTTATARWYTSRDAYNHWLVTFVDPNGKQRSIYGSESVAKWAGLSDPGDTADKIAEEFDHQARMGAAQGSQS